MDLNYKEYEDKAEIIYKSKMGKQSLHNISHSDASLNISDK